MTRPIPDCPQPETPIRERAWSDAQKAAHFTAEEVLEMASVLLHNPKPREWKTRAGNMLTAYADTLSKPADSGMEAEREFFARDFYEEAREGKKAWPGQCDSGRVGDEQLRAAAIIYGSGYRHGHEATVEGGYTDVVHHDRATYWLDTVREMVDEDNELRTTLAAQGQGEAVAEVYEGAFDTHYIACADPNKLPVGTKLYTAPPASPAGVPDVAAMVDRFLGWALPKDFAPDAGINYNPAVNINQTTGEPYPNTPSGTNLFTAEQAEAMFRYVLAAVPGAPEGDGGEG